MEHIIVLNSCHCTSFIGPPPVTKNAKYATQIPEIMPSVCVYVYVGVLKISGLCHFMFKLANTLVQNLYILDDYSLKTTER